VTLLLEADASPRELRPGRWRGPSVFHIVPGVSQLRTQRVMNSSRNLMFGCIDCRCSPFVASEDSEELELGRGDAVLSLAQATRE
jgi:hypothetical protein